MNMQKEAKLASSTGGKGGQSHFYWTDQICMSRDKNYFALPDYRVVKTASIESESNILEECPLKSR